MSFNIKSIFERDHVRYDGVRRINVYLMRVLYFLMAVFLAMDVWTYILGHKGPWEPQDAIDRKSVV